MRPRENAIDGCHRALAAPPRRAGPGIAEAVERQTAAMREPGLRAFPKPDVVQDDAPPWNAWSSKP